MDGTQIKPEWIWNTALANKADRCNLRERRSSVRSTLFCHSVLIHARARVPPSQAHRVGPEGAGSNRSAGGSVASLSKSMTDRRSRFHTQKSSSKHPHLKTTKRTIQNRAKELVRQLKKYSSQLNPPGWRFRFGGLSFFIAGSVCCRWTSTAVVRTELATQPQAARVSAIGNLLGLTWMPQVVCYRTPHSINIVGRWLRDRRHHASRGHGTLYLPCRTRRCIQNC